MGQSMSEQLKEETRPKNTRKRKRLHQVLTKLKKKDTPSNIENSLQTNVLCQYVLQELDNAQNLDKLINTLNMLLEKLLDWKKEVEEIRESSFILQRDKEDNIGEVASQNLLEENTNVSSDTNDEDNDTQLDGIKDSISKADSKLDSHYKDMSSRLVVNSDNVQDCIEDSGTKVDAIEDSVTKIDAMEDSHDKEITSSLVINKNRNGKYTAGVIFVGDNNICQINGTDQMRNTEKEADDKLMRNSVKEADDKLMVIMRRQLFALKRSNTRLEFENRILRRRSIDTADHGKKPECNLETGRRFYPSQRSNSFPSRTMNPWSLR